MARRATSLADRQASMRARYAPPAPSLAEKHWTPDELAEHLGVSKDWVQRKFRDEPGVLKFGTERLRLRIPQSVAQRVYEEMLA